MSRRRATRRRAAVAVLSSVVLAGLGLFWFARGRTTSTATPAIAPSARVVAPAHQTLPDGSRIEEKDGAAVAVHYTADVREVRLDRGEAHFQVAREAGRPFVVRAGTFAIEALGTAFSVDLTSERVDLLVTEGAVRISRQDGPANREVLRVGQRLVLPVAQARSETWPAPQTPTAPEQKARLAWRVPTLEFTGTTLREAIPLFNVHARTRLQLDPSLENIRLSGAVLADDADSLLYLLKTEFGIIAVRDGETVRLRRP